MKNSSDTGIAPEHHIDRVLTLFKHIDWANSEGQENKKQGCIADGKRDSFK